jgi:hypothetical protein
MSESSSRMRLYTIEFDRELIGLDGVPFALDDDRTLKLKDVAVEGLLMPKPGLSKDDKFCLFQLAKDIHHGKTDLTDEEFATLKRVIGDVYDQAIMGAAWLELDRQAACQQLTDREPNTTETPTL